MNVINNGKVAVTDNGYVNLEETNYFKGPIYQAELQPATDKVTLIQRLNKDKESDPESSRETNF